MSSWTHNACGDCWREQRGDRRPAAISNAEIATCCWCGKANRDGIYQLADPDETPCKGKHGDADS